uniref:Uncharacterized protein n=1 Tax=Anguilla anguilla TaxID=7936 RepID=A0A0E9PBC5_ANGAN
MSCEVFQHVTVSVVLLIAPSQRHLNVKSHSMQG